MSTTETGTRISDVSIVMVPVADQDRAIDFYVGTLGFEKRLDAPFADGMRWIEVAPPEAQTSIALAPPCGDGSIPRGGTEVSFATRDADAVHPQLRAAGVDVDERVRRMGEGVPPMFTFRDPEGNRYRVVERD